MHTDKDLNFIDKIVNDEVKEGKVDKVVTRFPPEPNGYLHIGSAYAINISHSIAQKYNGKFNLRFDDTNPTKEDFHFVDTIVNDMNWLGVDFGDKPLFGSDYAEQIFEYTKYLIKKGQAYVCNLSHEQIREYRGHNPFTLFK